MGVPLCGPITLKEGIDSTYIMAVQGTWHLFSVLGT